MRNDWKTKKKVWRGVSSLALAAGIWGVAGQLPGWQPVDICYAAVHAQPAAVWDFTQDLQGWKYGGSWAYDGTPVIAWDKSYAGSMKVSVDFRSHVHDSWSEVKFEAGKLNGGKPIQLATSNMLSFELYYNPAAMSTGSFKTKLYGKDEAGQEVLNAAPDIDLSKSQAAGNGYRKVQVNVPFQPVKGALSYLVLSLVGCSTDYHGTVFLKDIQFSSVDVPDGYAAKTEPVKPQQTVATGTLPIPGQVSLSDEKALPGTVNLYALLQGFADSPYVLYGHQNEMHRKVSKLAGVSDTEDMTGDIAAVTGVDGLALTGDELELTPAEEKAGMTLTDKLAKLTLAASRRGSVITMSCHMPNFALVAGKPKINGHYDFKGYSPNVTSGNVVRRILPGGDLNKVYTAYLDMVANYAGKLQQSGIPLIFRPFHENNGSWFWWGAAYCTPNQYKNLFRYTVSYLRENKDLHNLLVAYSPNGPFTNAQDYASRYPGDAYVDVIGFDSYHRDPEPGDNWMDGFRKDMQTVGQFAQTHHKLAAVTETGILVGSKGGALARNGNKRLDWFNEALRAISPQNMAYFMTWSNFSEDNFDEPYMVTDKRGHEMINRFIDFYNQPESVFAGQMPDYVQLHTKLAAAVQTYGSLTAPDSYSSILTPTVVKAQIHGRAGKVQLAMHRKDGSVAAVLDMKRTGDRAEAEIPAAAIQQVGKSVGTLGLLLDQKEVDTVPVLFNLEKPVPDPLKIDDFEGYYGEQSLLKAAYSTNCGTGCSVEPQLTGNREQGEYGLAFHYRINKNGYAGIIRSLGAVDWSKGTGVSFWLQPDGQGQKLICQLNSDGEDFEVDLSQLTKGTKPVQVKLPFSLFQGKNHGKFNPAAVQHFAIYCNNTGDAVVDSTLYVDSIQVY